MDPTQPTDPCETETSGPKALLSITGFTVPFLPMLYLVSTNFGFLLVVNFPGGVIWAGLALGLQNYVFDSVGPEDRAKAIALYSTVNAVGWSVGALLGSWLVERMPRRQLLWQLPLVKPLTQLVTWSLSKSRLGAGQLR
ncbi:MAG: hypothetical protein A2V62_07875 [Nitrospirae bacterium RBG_19FT_COMBO_58_9]|nr:MAG: hypothetical protein A2V62_07875 [Nitrospirae bacterium RBG_19FT_COMBO_58_9]